MSITTAHNFFIQLHLTEKCNLRCSHCYQSGERTEELTFSEIKETIGEVSETLKDWGKEYNIDFSSGFNITGGEPLLRKDLVQILEWIRQRGFDIYLLTNGTLITKQWAGILAGLGLKGVQVSMEGPEDIHEDIRGKGSFSSALSGVRSLLEVGLEVTLNTTLSDLNADYFMDTISVASSLGVQRLGFSRLVPSGKGVGLLNRVLNKDKLKELYNAISSMNVNGLEIVTGDPVASQMSLPESKYSGSIPSGGCAAGLSGLTIMPDGTVLPCRRLPIPIGNLRKDSLREIWAASTVLESLRDRSKYGGKCGKCARWAECRGCRAIAYAYSQSNGSDDFFAEDPQCFID